MSLRGKEQRPTLQEKKRKKNSVRSISSRYIKRETKRKLNTIIKLYSLGGYRIDFQLIYCLLKSNFKKSLFLKIDIKKKFIILVT